MYCWYKNKQTEIFFSETPFVGIRYPMPSMTKEERKSIEKYPFICKKKTKS